MNPSGFARLGIITAIAVLTAVGGSVAQTLPEVGFDRDDFLVVSNSGGDARGIFVLDQDLSLKGRFAGIPAANALSIDFDHQGRLVSRTNAREPFFVALARTHEPNGRPAPEYTDLAPDESATVDVRVTASDTYVAAALDDLFSTDNRSGLLEFERNGQFIRQLDSGQNYESVAVWEDGTIWAGGDSPLGEGFLNQFDLVNGQKTELFLNVGNESETAIDPPPFDGGQLGVTEMIYSRETDSMLLADFATLSVYERAMDGRLETTFELPVTLGDEPTLPGMGVTRGPNGDVYAALADTIYRFADDGTFLDANTIDLGFSAQGLTAWGILWAGNAALFNALPGDFDGDGLVAQGDLNLVLSNWGTDPTQAGTVDDFVITAMLDGLVDQGELNAVLNHWGDASPPDLSGVTVPEPAGAFALLACGFIRPRRACVRRRPGAGGPGRSSSSRWCGGL